MIFVKDAEQDVLEQKELNDGMGGDPDFSLNSKIFLLMTSLER